MIENFIAEVGSFCEVLFFKAWLLFNSPASTFYWPTLLSALLIAILIPLRRREKMRGDGRSFNLALCELRRYITNSSFRADIFFAVFGVFGFFSLFGWAIVAGDIYSSAVRGLLDSLFGHRSRPDLSLYVQLAIATIASFCAYELGYWLDHYLKHRIQFLWSFHRVHHSAEVLSPLTIYRMHPVDMVLFSNIISIFVGATSGVLDYFRMGAELGLDGKNFILIVFAFLTVHLQHSHVWLPTTGLLGRIVLSPAHHQIHHSLDPAHHNKNYGSCLAIWDWIFGTLLVPTKEVQRFSFGVLPAAKAAHTFKGEVIDPFLKSWETVIRKKKAG